MDNVTATVGTSKKYAREDHIHPLNKNYFLTDETAAALGLGDNPTVDEALGVLKKDVDNVEKVGDIKTTVRTDLGDDWLLCNGEAVNTEEYPELAGIAGGAVTLSFSTDNDDSSVEYQLTYGDNMWIKIYSGMSAVSFTYKTTLGTGSWASISINNSKIKNLARVYYLEFNNGLWVGFGYGYSSSIYQNAVFYSTDILSGPWTAYEISSIGGQKYKQYTAAGGLAFSGDYYAYARMTTDNKLVAGYTNNITQDSWTETTVKTLDSGEVFTISNIQYVNGRWVIAGATKKTESDISYGVGLIYYASDINGPWESVELWRNELSNLDYTYHAVRYVSFANNQWVATGKNYEKNGTSYTQNYSVAYTEGADIAGPWIAKMIWDVVPKEGNGWSSASTPTVGPAFYSNGKWNLYLTFYAKVASSSWGTYLYLASGALSSTMQTKALVSSEQSSSRISNSYRIADNLLVIPGYYYSSGYRQRLSYASANSFCIPTITTEGAYNYIKGR